MTAVSRAFTVSAAPDVVVAYLADFGHAEQWDPGTERCTRNDRGPVQVGSSWHNTTRIAGVSTELAYTLEELTSVSSEPAQPRRSGVQVRLLLEEQGTPAAGG